MFISVDLIFSESPDAVGTLLTYVENLSELVKVISIENHDALHHKDKDNFEQVHEVTYKDDSVHPHAVALTPVFKGLFGEDRDDIVGAVFSIIPFDKYMTNLLPKGVDSLEVVLWNTCNQTFTFHIQGPDVSTTCIVIFAGDTCMHSLRLTKISVLQRLLTLETRT